MIRPSNRLVAYKTITLTVLFATTLISNAWTEQIATEVDNVFADLQKPGSPGCALGVYRDGKVIYSKGYGLASVELDAPITPETVFDIGSTSKQFTAASILLLEQQGKLSLNDEVRKYIPELPDYAKNGGHKITILNLLNHTSGLRDYLALLELEGLNGDSVTTDDDALSILVRQKQLNFSPGNEWRYSNTGFFLLSVIVKRVSGMTLREFASKNVFQPMGMTHTHFRDDHTMLIPHRALAYDRGEKSGYKLNVSYFEQLGDGAVHTSVQDLAKWDENFYSVQIGGKSFLAELQERGKLNSGKVLDYAKALFIGDYRGLHTVRHGGAWGGYRSELLRFPDQHFSVACLCNLSDTTPGRRADRVADIYLGTLMKPAKPSALPPEKARATPAVSLSAAQLAPLTGTYRNAAEGNVARVSIENDKLQWEIFGKKFGLRALSPTQFVPVDFPVDAELTFELDTNHAVRDMKISGNEEIAATYQPVTEFRSSAGEVSAYAGDFRSDELGVVYQFAVVDGKLSLVAISDVAGILRTGVPTPAALRPTITDEFEISNLGATADFLREAKRDIMGFNFDAGGTPGIEFLRIASTGRK